MCVRARLEHICVRARRKARQSRGVRGNFEIWVYEMALLPHSDSTFERNAGDINYVYFHS